MADVARWQNGEKPAAMAGYKVEVYAGKLDHPRNMVTLPNGDVLVAETNKPASLGGGGIVGLVSNWLMNKARGGRAIGQPDHAFARQGRQRNGR